MRTGEYKALPQAKIQFRHYSRQDYSIFYRYRAVVLLMLRRFVLIWQLEYLNCAQNRPLLIAFFPAPLLLMVAFPVEVSFAVS